MKFVIIALLGALAAILSNMGVAVFNDGLRPVVPEYLEGRMDKKALAATSFALSFGLVIGFGIPVSIAASIILIHSILLGTDIIGSWCPSGKKGIIMSGVIGALYGLGLVSGLQAIVDLFAKLPINFLPQLGQVGAPVVAAFAVFPALVVAYQFGFKKGIITLCISFLVRQITLYYGKFKWNGATIKIDQEGMALLAGMIIMLVFAMKEKPDPNAPKVDLVSIFAERVKKIKKNLPILAVMGGLISAATSLAMVAGDPISLNLLKEGKNVEAAMTAFARGIGFIPLVATTAITTGVYAPAGMTFVFVIGLLVKNPLLSFVLGAGVMSLEILFLDVLARFLDKFPGVKKCGDNIRTSMSKVLEVALLVGGLMAANAMAPGLGLFVVIGLYVLNKTSKKPIVDMAVGPMGAILVGILINILFVVGLYLPPVV
ncbi:YhfT family protein [Clostridium algidicarnis]|uniref:YhfT family protein n=1 Tax=Clostridium algidicarnis TaxID=37659 RepID=UPI001C0DD009|nr:YhfT family protein [Clostridium algidicarnis]MBU3209390.1 YhfT family protein [Clostridium algidicarnis]MBU3228101.1 YhfT family protein [Clostridium algidicarnis]MBU3251730.1 YhfT family protein [Clostridium algidicarnis]